MNPIIEANERVTFYKDLPAVMDLKALIDKLDAQYNVNSSDKDNSFGIIDPEAALISAMYESNIFFRLYGYSSDMSHIPMYEQVPIVSEAIILSKTGDVGLLGNPYRDKQKKHPIDIKISDKNRLVALRKEARDEITKNLPRRPVFDTNATNYAKILDEQGFATEAFKRSIYVQSVNGSKGTFTIKYSWLHPNKNPHFSTTFNGWQNQEDMDHQSLAYTFYKKWNIFHLVEMTQEEFDEMRKDASELRNM